MVRRALPILCVLLAASCGCVRTGYNLATQRQEYTITSTDKEVEMGRKLAKRVQAELSILGDPTIQDRVRAIGERLVAVCDRQELIYRFAVVDEDAVNAFSLPADRVRLFVFAPLPEEFFTLRTVNDQKQVFNKRQEGRVLYSLDVFDPEEL